MKIEKYFNNDLKGKKFVIWGLVFKFEIDDIREVFFIDVMNFLLDKGVLFLVFDLEVMLNIKK